MVMMYDINNELYSEESNCSRAIQMASDHYNDQIFAYISIFESFHFVNESAKKSLGEAIKDFFTTIKGAFRRFIQDIKFKIQKNSREKEIERRIKNLREQLREGKKNGYEKVEIMDVWKYQETYVKMNSELWNYARKFSKVKYTKTWQIEDDLKAFDQVCIKYTKEIEEIEKTKIKVPLDKLLDFVEDEIRGKSEVLKTLNDAMDEFDRMYQASLDLEKDTRKEGAEIIPKHMNMIRRITTKISTTLHKLAARFIAIIMFLLPF